MNITHLILASFVTATAWAEFSDTYAFFVKHEGKLNPVRLDLHYGSGTALVWNESTVDATEFFYKEGSAFFNNTSRTGRMAFDLFSGIALREDVTNQYTTLVLENNTGRLLNFFFYSRKISNRQVIESEKFNDQGFLVDLYFMKYDRATKKPLQDLYESKDVERTPHRLYVRDKDGLEPLSGGNSSPSKGRFFPLHYGKSGDVPADFFIQNNLFFTEIGPYYAGYLSYLNGKIGLATYPQDYFEFDKNGKFGKWEHFSCNNSESGAREISNSLEACSDPKIVDVYLLPYDKKTGKPQLGDLEPRLTLDSTPHAFYVNQNETWLTISFRANIYNNALAAFVPKDTESEDKPVEFTLREKGAFTVNTSIPGFAQFSWHEFLVHDQDQGSFDLDTDMKVIDHKFYMRADRSISVDEPENPDSPQVILYFLPLNRTSGKPLDRVDMPGDNDEGTKMTSISSSMPTMAGTSESSVSSVSEIPETSVLTMSDTPENSVNTMSHMPEKSVPTTALIPETSIMSMSDISETSVITMSDVPESALSSVSENPKSSIHSMSDIPVTSIETMSEIETSVNTMAKIPETSFRTMSDNPETSVNTKLDIPTSVKTAQDIPETSVNTIAGASNSSGISHAPRPSTSMSPVAGETSIDESSKWKPTTLTRNTTTTATICTECQAASTVTEWNTHTNFVTYCPERTTITFSKCNNGCYLSTTTVTSATTVTCPGVCIIPTTIVVNGPAETANVGHYGPKDTVKSPSNVNSPAETVKAEEGSENGGADIVAAGGSAQKGGEDIMAGGSSPKKPVGSPSFSNSPNRIGKVEDFAQKQGDSNNQGNSKNEGSSNKPGNGSNSPKPKTDIASGEKASDSNKASNGSNRPKPKSGNSDTTTTQTITDIVTAPSVLSFNGASKNAIGACVLGLAALLL